MPRIFVSYSRVDLHFVQQLVNRLQQMRPNDPVWYDSHGLLGGDRWWDSILKAIGECDLFIYVLSNESIESKYCQAEFTEAQRLQKPIIPIQARDRTDITGDLSEIQYVDMKNGVDNGEAVAKLNAAIERQLAKAKNRRPLWKPATPKPKDEHTPTRGADAPDIDTPPLEVKDKPQTVDPPTRKRLMIWLAVFILFAFVAGVMFLVSNAVDLRSGSTVNTVASPSPSETVEPEETPTLSNQQRLATVQAEETFESATQTASRLTAEANETEIAAGATLLALSATVTPEPTATLTLTPTPEPPAVANSAPNDTPRFNLLSGAWWRSVEDTLATHWLLNVIIYLLILGWTSVFTGSTSLVFADDNDLISMGTAYIILVGPPAYAATVFYNDTMLWILVGANVIALFFGLASASSSAKKKGT